jgi:hypothetical protein
VRSSAAASAARGRCIRATPGSPVTDPSPSPPSLHSTQRGSRASAIARDGTSEGRSDANGSAPPGLDRTRRARALCPPRASRVRLATRQVVRSRPPRHARHRLVVRTGARPARSSRRRPACPWTLQSRFQPRSGDRARQTQRARRCAAPACGAWLRVAATCFPRAQVWVHTERTRSMSGRSRSSTRLECLRAGRHPRRLRHHPGR